MPVPAVARARRLVLTCLFLTVSLPAVHADVDAGKLGQIRGRMQAFVEQQEIAGAVTVVGRSSGILSHEAVGSRDLAKRQPMTKDTLFRIASMTKPITALGIMILVDEGKLAVTDPIAKHLPEFRGQLVITSRDNERLVLTKPSRLPTIRDLLTHTSGVTAQLPPGLAELYRTRTRTLAEGVLAFSQRPLDFEPGAKWAYCNPGIDTLGRLIEVASGLAYEEFLRQRIFTPLGMHDTTFYPDAKQLERGARIYDKKDGQLVETAQPIIGLVSNARYPIPAGGLWSTGADLAKLYQAMLGKGALSKTRIVSAQSLAEMTKLQTGTLTAGFTPGMGFGYGWAVVVKPQGVTGMLSPGAFGHGGAFGTQGWLDPARDLFVVLLIQRVGLANADASKMRQELQELATAAVGK